MPSVNFATENQDINIEIASPFVVSDSRQLNKVVLSGASTGSPGPTDIQSAVAGEFNYPGEERKNAGYN